AVANRFLGYVYSLRGQMEAALPFLERALAIAVEHELFQATIFSSAYLGHALLLLGERKRGLECLARALEKSTWPVRANWDGFGSVTASAYLAAGGLDEARAETQQGLTAVAERNARGHRAPLYAWRLRSWASKIQLPRPPVLKKLEHWQRSSRCAPKSPTATS